MDQPNANPRWLGKVIKKISTLFTQSEPVATQDNTAVGTAEPEVGKWGYQFFHVDSERKRVYRDVVEAVGPWHCEYDVTGFLVRSEDFDFCDRAHALGYEIWADCDLEQVHNG